MRLGRTGRNTNADWFASFILGLLDIERTWLNVRTQTRCVGSSTEAPAMHRRVVVETYQEVLRTGCVRILVLPEGSGANLRFGAEKKRRIGTRTGG